MKKVSFTEMKNGTKEDYLFLDKHEKEYASHTADRILKFMSGLTETLEGYQVSRLEPSLQSATKALKAGEDEDMEMARKGEWGGSEKDPYTPESRNGFDAKDLKDATAYHRERYGKREFKGKAPLATSKGSTLVAREGLLKQLKKKFGKDTTNKSILSEENILNDE